MEFLLVTLFVAAASASFAPLHKAKERIDGSYIVVLNDEQSLSEAVSTIRNAPFFSTLGGRIDRIYGTALNGFSATMSEKALDFIRRMDFVKYVEEDGIVRATATAASWGLDRVDQRDLPLNGDYSPPGNFGTGAHVYVIDTGINMHHADYEGRAECTADFCANNRNGEDCNGHGSHCAGTVGGFAYGIAREARLYGIRVLNCIGSGSTSGVVGGMDWVAENHQKPAVASMSLGGGASTTTDLAVTRMDTAGVTVVVAAGNDNADACGYSPARAEKAYTVGATDSSDNRASFSNYGSCVDIFAPGVGITSCWYNSNTATRTISGTSMACPHVAGAAALILGNNPDYTTEQVKVELTSNASPNKVTNSESLNNLLLYVGN